MLNMNAKVKGCIFGAVAASTYGLNPLFALPLYGAGLTPADVLLWRYLFAIVILWGMAMLRGQRFAVPRSTIMPLFVLGLLMGFSSLLLFESYECMDVGIASTLLFVYPLMVAVLMAIFFRQRITVFTMVCIAVAMSGIAMLNQGADGRPLSLKGVVLVMASALSYALYLVWVNGKAFAKIPTLVLTFYVILSGSVIFIAQSAMQPAMHLPPTPMMWGCAVALGLLPTAVSLVCTSIAIQNIGSTPTAILGALEPLTAVCIGVAVFGETLTASIVCGLTLIIIAVTCVIAADKIAAPLLRMRRLFPAFFHRLLHK